jgi:hypothetical protein
MLQFYFLSVLLNIGVGLILVYAQQTSADADVPDAADLEPDESAPAGKKGLHPSRLFKGDMSFISTPAFRLVVGFASVFTGIMKLLSVVHNDIPVIGDFFPALAGIAGGFALLLEYYMDASSTDLSIGEPVRKVFIDGRRYIGIFCLFAGLLHFLFPQVLLL